jgi:hypothetical protein
MGLLFMGPHIRDSGGTAHDLVHVKEERGVGEYASKEKRQQYRRRTEKKYDQGPLPPSPSQLEWASVCLLRRGFLSLKMYLLKAKSNTT